MSDEKEGVEWDNLAEEDSALIESPDPEAGETAAANQAETEGEVTRTAADLEPVFDIPVNVSAVLGKTHLEVSQLMQLGPGTIVELDRKVGEAIDIFVNNRLVARGEVVVIDERLGVTMTEIIKGDSV
ncbi:MAG TPA: flagellar motor switch protein FliN [Alphaproteobacteria bacterium]|jgi:flagellar motor switch protein FliN/FliY|nr:flagellar motor switch protein FliN [Alphaproteobacteria bacterium]HAM48067.1 flagellar motor switch protein FliN [Alphaproteobacteria bacterium]HBA43345.1 flagellar motor switch protein FliN [Alphaproteobacteria bacterium]HBC53835.1 flagellar motor switch protein FliN [Alphaproteobacteria bacterium]HBF99912.1 flagellar motor switch protein FliN [Alphaproteobacteria bacterium]